MEKTEIVMDYEQKYNEALERAKKTTRAGGDVAMVIVQDIFPELAESEDERIKKDLITYLKSVQGETLDLTISVPKWVAYLEKQKEQKPAEWSDEDSIGWDEAFACVTRAEKAAKNEEELQNAVSAEKWLKEIKFKYCVHPVKQEWSQEDEKIVNNIVSVLGQYIDYKAVSGTGSGYATPRYAKEIDWLNSLRTTNQGWSKEDEEMRKLHIGCRSRRQKPEKSVNGKCKHRLVFSRNCQDNRGNVFPIYKCEKCGYEQIGKEHLRLEEYEN